MDATTERLTNEMLEANKRLAALGVQGERSWTEDNVRLLAASIVRAGRKAGISNAVIMMRSRDFIEKTITQKVMELRAIAQKESNPPSLRDRALTAWIALRAKLKTIWMNR